MNESIPLRMKNTFVATLFCFHVDQWKKADLLKSLKSIFQYSCDRYIIFLFKQSIGRHDMEIMKHIIGARVDVGNALKIFDLKFAWTPYGELKSASSIIN